MKQYQRLGVEQLIRERTHLMEIKRTLINEQKIRKQQLSKSCIEMEQMKSMADQLLEIILLIIKFKRLQSVFQRKEVKPL